MPNDQSTQVVDDQRALAEVVLSLHEWARALAAKGDSTANTVFQQTGVVIFSAQRLSE